MRGDIKVPSIKNSQCLSTKMTKLSSDLSDTVGGHIAKKVLPLL